MMPCILFPDRYEKPFSCPMLRTLGSRHWLWQQSSESAKRGPSHTVLGKSPTTSARRKAPDPPERDQEVSGVSLPFLSLALGLATVSLFFAAGRSSAPRSSATILHIALTSSSSSFLSVSEILL